jgi:hypothetical protein
MEDKPPEAAAAPDRSGRSVCHVFQEQGSGQLHLTRETAEDLLADGRFFRLDIWQPVNQDFDFVFIVVYAAVPDDDRLVEVHCFYSERFLVTVHRDNAPAFTEIRDRFSKLIDGYRDLLTGADGRLPLHGLQPAQRRDEAAGRDRDDLPSLELVDRFLRPELRLGPQPVRSGLLVVDVVRPTLVSARLRTHGRCYSREW